MKTLTSLVAKQVRLQSWADQIKDCENRPVNMSVDTWCDQHGVSKANYYYRLTRLNRYRIHHDLCSFFCAIRRTFLWINFQTILRFHTFYTPIYYFLKSFDIVF